MHLALVLSAAAAAAFISSGALALSRAESTVTLASDGDVVRVLQPIVDSDLVRAAADARTQTRTAAPAEGVAPREPVPSSSGSRDGVTTQPPGAVVAAIRAAAARYGLDPTDLEAIARCESSLRVLAVGRDQELGLFQWKPTSWQQISKASGLEYSIDRIFDVDAQAELAAWAIANGYRSWWSCAR